MAAFSHFNSRMKILSLPEHRLHIIVETHLVIEIERESSRQVVINIQCAFFDLIRIYLQCARDKQNKWGKEKDAGKRSENLTTQQESLVTPNGFQCIARSNSWSQPYASTTWTSSGLNPFLPASKTLHQCEKSVKPYTQQSAQ